jgi:hypothetical protein
MDSDQPNTGDGRQQYPQFMIYLKFGTAVNKEARFKYPKHIKKFAIIILVQHKELESAS